ncbi:MAG: hypothetical protein IT256_00865 [Chitinophagaceae bacterium]|nr:hypothetical protein [Chitinophagaceae bacterium]
MMGSHAGIRDGSAQPGAKRSIGATPKRNDKMWGLGLCHSNLGWAACTIVATLAFVIIYCCNHKKIKIMSEEIKTEESFFDKAKNALNNLKDKAEDALEELSDKDETTWDELEEKAEDAWDATKEKASELADKLQNKTEELAANAKEKANDAVDAVSGKIEDLKNKS